MLERLGFSRQGVTDWLNLYAGAERVEIFDLVYKSNAWNLDLYEEQFYHGEKLRLEAKVQTCIRTASKDNRWIIPRVSSVLA